MIQPIYYMQTDSLWKNHNYSAPGEKKTIGSSGCGVACSAMVIATLKNKNITPVETAEWSMAHGYKALNQGTYYTYFIPQFKEYGIECKRLNTSNLYGKSSSIYHTEALNALKNGDWVICCFGKGHYTQSGHFVLIYGYENGYIYVNDPASKASNRIKCLWNTVASQVKYLWTVTVPDSLKKKETTTEKGENKYMKGIDISKYQTSISFTDAKKAGYDFVIIRIGYNKTKDPYFESHYTNAKAAGLKVGAYFYATSTTEAEAINDANRVLGWLGGKTLDMPLAYDMEEGSMKLSTRKDLNSKQFNAFADTVRAKGFVPMLYTGSSMFNNYFNKTLIKDPVWIANYGSNTGKNNGCPNVGMTVHIHQYTSAAIADDFYTAKLDRNQMMVSYEELMKKTNSSTNTTVPSTSKANSIIKAGQDHANNFAQCGLVEDGVYGSKTKKGGVKVLQRAINLDYKSELAEDGVWGSKSEKALGKHYVKRGETQYMVTAAEILLMLKGYDCKGVELPGKFGSGLEKCVKQYQKDKGLSQTGIVDATTFKSLIS